MHSPRGGQDNKRNSLNRNGKSRGFTLVELLVVVVIIIALGAIAVALLLNQREKAVEGVLDSDARELQGLLLNAYSLEEPLTYAGANASTPGRLWNSNLDSADVTGTFPSGAVPPSDACMTISVPAEGLSRTVCVGTGGGGGAPGFSITYPSTPIPPGSDGETLVPIVVGGDGDFTFTPDIPLPDGFTIDPDTGVITGPGAGQWPFPAALSAGVVDALGEYSSSSTERVIAMSDGGFVAVGYFVGTLDFDGIAVSDSSSPGGVFVARAAPNGEWLWVTTALSDDFASINAVVPTTGGDVVVGGEFYGELQIGSDTLDSADGTGFIARVSSDGDWGWTLQGGGGVIDLVPSSGGNFLSLSALEGATDIGGIPVTPLASEGVFAAGISGSGEWEWVADVQTTSSMGMEGRLVALPDGGAAYVSRMRETVYIDGDTLTSEGAADVLAAEISPSGSWEWVAQGGGSGDEGNLRVVANADGEIGIAGTHANTATFGTHTLSHSGAWDIFVAQLSTNGNWDWATTIGSASGEYLSAMTTLSDGTFAIAGVYVNSFDIGSTTLPMPPDLSDEVFVARLTDAGDWAWALTTGGSSGPVSASTINTMVGTPDGGLALTGWFYGSLQFGTDLVASPTSSYSVGVAAKVSSAGSWEWAVGAVPDETAVTVDWEDTQYAEGAFIDLLANGQLLYAGMWVGAQARIGDSQLSALSGGGEYETEFFVRLDPSTGHPIPGGFPMTVPITVTDGEGNSASTSVVLSLD